MLRSCVITGETLYNICIVIAFVYLPAFISIGHLMIESFDIKTLCFFGPTLSHNNVFLQQNFQSFYFTTSKNPFYPISIIRCFELTIFCSIQPPLSNKQQRLSPQVTNESTGILNLGVNGILEAACPYSLDAQPPQCGKYSIQARKNMQNSFSSI